MSVEDPTPNAEAPPVQTPAPEAPAPSAASPSAPPPSPHRGLLIGIVVVLALALGGYLVSRGGALFSGQQATTAYTVQPYTPPAHLVSARDHVLAYARPDTSSPTVVMFGPGVALNIAGRVSRGLGDDWYAISWNGQTAFIRQQDTMTGEEAPPVAPEHPVKPEEQVDDEETDTPDFPLGDEAAPLPEVVAGPYELGNVDWIRGPNARDFQRFYPRRALNDNQSGRVVLDCLAEVNGRLRCSIANENPEGYGFGEAALSISQQLRVQPELPNGRSVAGGHLQLPLAFRAE